MGRRWCSRAMMPLIMAGGISAMPPLQPHEIVGTWSGILLPVASPMGDINFTAMAATLDALFAAGVSGVYTSGTAEELYTLSDDEFRAMGRLVSAKANAASMPFQIGVSDASAQTMLRRARIVVEEKWQPSAVQIILPDYYIPTVEEQLTFIRTMAQVLAPIGLVLYNPGNAKKVLAPAEFEPLVPFVVGLKVVDGNRDWFTAMHAIAGNVSIGISGHHLATGVLFGANCSYSNVAALQPRGAQQWYKLMGSNLNAALALERRIDEFWYHHVVPFIAEEHYSDMAVDKLLAAAGAWAPMNTTLRWPYRSIPPSEVSRVAEIARKQLPELFSSADMAAFVASASGLDDGVVV